MYNISSQEEKQITVNESSQEYPAIYEEKIVWVDMRNGYLDIYMTTLTGQGLQS
jgi:beta propeller repeat protein